MLSTRTTYTGETFLLEQERGLGERQPLRRWNPASGYMEAQPLRYPKRALRPARAPRIYNRPGPAFEIFDRKTGVRLWIISGNTAQVMDQLLKQLAFVKMPISAIRFQKVTAVT